MSKSKDTVTSAASAPPAAAPTPARPRKDEALIREVDACVDHIRSLIPAEPYVLTVPSDVPIYRHLTWEDANAWRRGTPFDSDDDEDIQYATFLYREQGESLLVCRSVVDIERERREKERKANGVRSGTTTPFQAAGPPKKKITLSAYKSKHANGAAARNADKAVNGVKAGETVNGGSKLSQEVQVGSDLAAPHGQKRLVFMQSMFYSFSRD